MRPEPIPTSSTRPLALDTTRSRYGASIRWPHSTLAPRIGFWLRRVLAFIAGNLGVHFLPVGVIFRGPRPRRHIFRRTAEPCRYGVRHMAGARCESGRNNHECNQTSHHGTRNGIAATIKRGIAIETPIILAAAITRSAMHIACWNGATWCVQICRKYCSNAGAAVRHVTAKYATCKLTAQ